MREAGGKTRDVGRYEVEEGPGEGGEAEAGEVAEFADYDGGGAELEEHGVDCLPVDLSVGGAECQRRGRLGGCWMRPKV